MNTRSRRQNDLVSTTPSLRLRGQAGQLKEIHHILTPELMEWYIRLEAPILGADSSSLCCTTLFGCHHLGLWRRLWRPRDDRVIQHNYFGGHLRLPGRLASTLIWKQAFHPFPGELLTRHSCREGGHLGRQSADTPRHSHAGSSAFNRVAMKSHLQHREGTLGSPRTHRPGETVSLMVALAPEHRLRALPFCSFSDWVRHTRAASKCHHAFASRPLVTEGEYMPLTCLRFKWWSKPIPKADPPHSHEGRLRLACEAARNRTVQVCACTGAVVPAGHSFIHKDNDGPQPCWPVEEKRRYAWPLCSPHTLRHEVGPGSSDHTREPSR